VVWANIGTARSTVSMVANSFFILNPPSVALIDRNGLAMTVLIPAINAWRGVG
jgi:hypothetical protein